MIFNIPSWPASSDLTHYATTWKLARDVDFLNIEEELIEDVDNILSWNTNTIIPTGEVWYIKALRHLKDSNGNIINNTKWIGPKPVYNEESNLPTYLAPKYYITQPYISNIAYTPGLGIELELAPYETNVEYLYTIVTIKNIDTNEYLTVVKQDLRASNNQILISSQDVDFSNVTRVAIVVAHVANHSTVSNSYVEIFNIKSVYYNIEGNRTELDPISEHEFNIVSTSNTSVVPVAAYLKSLDDVIIKEATIENNNNIKFKANLKFETSYKLVITLRYTLDSGITEEVEEVVYISTMTSDERDSYNPEFKYSYIIKKIATLEDDPTTLNIDATKIFNSEEFFTYITPVAISDTSVKVTVIDETVGEANNIINQTYMPDLNLPANGCLRLISTTKGYYQSMDANNNELILMPYNYNGYTQSFDFYKENSIIGEESATNEPFIRTGIKVATAAINKLVEVAGGLYLVGVSLQDSNTIVVKHINLETDIITDVYAKTYSSIITDLSLAPYKDDHILIVPISDGIARMQQFSMKDKTIRDTIVIPTDFRGKLVYSERLKNGNIIHFKIDDNVKALDYYYTDVYAGKNIVKSLVYNGSGTIKQILYLRDGTIMLPMRNDSATELWKFI